MTKQENEQQPPPPKERINWNLTAALVLSILMFIAIALVPEHREAVGAIVASIYASAYLIVGTIKEQQ